MEDRRFDIRSNLDIFMDVILIRFRTYNRIIFYIVWFYINKWRSWFLPFCRSACTSKLETNAKSCHWLAEALKFLKVMTNIWVDQMDGGIKLNRILFEINILTSSNFWKRLFVRKRLCPSYCRNLQCIKPWAKSTKPTILVLRLLNNQNLNRIHGTHKFLKRRKPNNFDFSWFNQKLWSYLLFERVPY